MFILSARALTASATAGEALAQTPPMGWNSFDSYGVYLHEDAAFANLEAMADKPLPYGYEYFVIDNGWFGEYTLQEGTIFPYFIMDLPETIKMMGQSDVKLNKNGSPISIQLNQGNHHYPPPSINGCNYFKRAVVLLFILIGVMSKDRWRTFLLLIIECFIFQQNKIRTCGGLH